MVQKCAAGGRQHQTVVMKRLNEQHILTGMLSRSRNAEQCAESLHMYHTKAEGAADAQFAEISGGGSMTSTDMVAHLHKPSPQATTLKVEAERLGSQEFCHTSQGVLSSVGFVRHSPI